MVNSKHYLKTMLPILFPKDVLRGLSPPSKYSAI